MDIDKAIKKFTEDIRKVSCSPRLDSEILIMKALNISRSYLYTHKDKSINMKQKKLLDALLKRRMQNEPIAYITGKKEFWSREFYVSRDTLIPRPESELLIEELLKLTNKQETTKILELGTGCGALSISIALELNNSLVTALDISRKALKIALKNAKKHQIENVNFLESDWYKELNKKKFDFILSNPPYVKKNDPSLDALNFEPLKALVSGIDGLDSIRYIITHAKYHIKNGGTLLIEHGKDQKKDIFDIFNTNSWKNITCIEDLRGFPRLTMAKYAT